MLKDQCILVDDADRVIGAASKAAAHRFEGATPNGLLHRAFSVFLFDPAGAVCGTMQSSCLRLMSPNQANSRR